MDMERPDAGVQEFIYTHHKGVYFISEKNLDHMTQ